MTSEPDLTRRPRTRRVFSEDDMTRMATLYYDSSVPMHRAAGEFGVPASTFLRWIAEMDWPRRRAQASRAQASRARDIRAQERPAPLPAPSPAPSPTPASATRPLLSLDAQMEAKLNEPVDPILLPYLTARRTPSLLTALRKASVTARREIDAAARMTPQTMADRERVAALIDRLSRSLDRITKSIMEEERKRRWREAVRGAR